MTNQQVARRFLYVVAATVAFLGVWYLVTPYYGPIGSNESRKAVDDFRGGTRAVCAPIFVPVTLSSEWPLVENCRKVGALRKERMWLLFATAAALSIATRLALGDVKPDDDPNRRRDRIKAFLREETSS